MLSQHHYGVISYITPYYRCPYLYIIVPVDYTLFTTCHTPECIFQVSPPRSLVHCILYLYTTHPTTSTHSSAYIAPRII